MNIHYLDDFTPGERFVTDGVRVTEAQIIEFALQYDPQYFHLDAEAAAASPYGGLIASGFHTIALTFRLFVQTGVLGSASLGSPGIDELRWRLPVRPGDTLHAEVEVLEVTPSASRPERGAARLLYRTVNQHGETVASFIVNHLLLRRPVGAD